MSEDPVLLLTRPEAASRRFLAELEVAAGRHLRALVAPLMRIDGWTPLMPETPPAALILTSERGAAAASRMRFGPLPAWCVGERTAEAAREAGLDARAAGGDAERLLTAILNSGEAGPFLHLRGAHARGDLAARLSAAGRPCGEIVVYDQTALSPSPEMLELLGGSNPVVVPLFSPRSAALLARLAPVRAPLAVAALSPAVADAAAPLSDQPFVADRPDADAMIDATLRALATFGLRHP